MAWIETSPGQIVSDITYGTGGGGSNCPAGWEENFDRSQMSTQVIIGRQSPSDVPVLRYVYTTTNPPPPGEMSLNGSQEAATMMRLSGATDLGDDGATWIEYLHAGSSMSVAGLGPGANSRQYLVTGDVIIHHDLSYVEVPIAWDGGGKPGPPDPGQPTDEIAFGPVDITLSISNEVPELWLDQPGIDHYGPMSFTRTDLINADRDLFEKLAQRIIDVRGFNSVPRLEAVTLDARTGGDRGVHNINLMSLTSPEKPSRYLMRLSVGPRLIFDRMCFATAVRHFISRDEWTLRITLDIAEWAAQL